MRARHLGLRRLTRMHKAEPRGGLSAHPRGGQAQFLEPGGLGREGSCNMGSSKRVTSQGTVGQNVSKGTVP